MTADWKRPTDDQRREIDALLARMAASCAPAIELTWSWRDEQRDLRITGMKRQGSERVDWGNGAHQGEIAQSPDPLALVEGLARKVIEGAPR